MTKQVYTSKTKSIKMYVQGRTENHRDVKFQLNVLITLIHFCLFNRRRFFTSRWFKTRDDACCSICTSSLKRDRLFSIFLSYKGRYGIISNLKKGNRTAVPPYASIYLLGVEKRIPTYINNFGEGGFRHTYKRLLEKISPMHVVNFAYDFNKLYTGDFSSIMIPMRYSFIMIITSKNVFFFLNHLIIELLEILYHIYNIFNILSLFRTPKKTYQILISKQKR